MHHENRVFARKYERTLMTAAAYQEAHAKVGRYSCDKVEDRRSATATNSGRAPQPVSQLQRKMVWERMMRNVGGSTDGRRIMRAVARAAKSFARTDDLPVWPST